MQQQQDTRHMGSAALITLAQQLAEILRAVKVSIDTAGYFSAPDLLNSNPGSTRGHGEQTLVRRCNSGIT